MTRVCLLPYDACARLVHKIVFLPYFALALPLTDFCTVHSILSNLPSRPPRSALGTGDRFLRAVAIRIMDQPLGCSAMFCYLY